MREILHSLLWFAFVSARVRRARICLPVHSEFIIGHPGELRVPRKLNLHRNWGVLLDVLHRPVLGDDAFLSYSYNQRNASNTVNAEGISTCCDALCCFVYYFFQFLFFISILFMSCSKLLAPSSWSMI